jgi:phosphoribosyl 1,2-cyclic phosphate phosphodiesterase
VNITFLGTGTSHGVPMIGCDCLTCRSEDPRDQRLRTSIYVQMDDGTGILVDAGPDLRQQALRHHIRRVDAIIFTHGHADHIFGLDETRRFTGLSKRALPCYGDELTLADIRKTFAYVFDPGTPRGGGLPDLDLRLVEGPIRVGPHEVAPVPLMHGERPILGLRFASFAYLTDCSRIPDESWPLLAGVRTLVLDALRDRPHPTHFTVAEALEVVARLAPARTYFTHICHDLPHAATCARLPRGVELAYDGLVLAIGDGE